MDYSKFIIEKSALRQPEPVRDIVGRFIDASREVVQLGGGKPSPQAIPINEISFSLKDGSKFILDSSKCDQILTYGPTEGYPPLVDILKEFVNEIHSPPLMNDVRAGDAETDLLVTCGGQNGLSMSIDMLTDPGDYVVVPELCYSGLFTHMKSLKVKYVPVASDEYGMDPHKLTKALSKWNKEDMVNKKGGAPKYMYVNPNGNNPTSISYTAERKKEIYKVCQEHNLIIIEDDPYFFLQFQDFQDYAPSFLCLDTDGRVLRIDSFSKVLSAGLRIGYTTGPKILIDRISMHVQSTTAHPSGVSQAMAHEILQHWGMPGLLSHAKFIREVYEERKNIMLEAANEYLKDLCEWSEPKGGMFFWFTVPKLKNTLPMIEERALAKNVVLVPGCCYYTDDNQHNKLRACYSEASPQQIRKGIKSLADLIREEIKLLEL